MFDGLEGGTLERYTKLCCFCDTLLLADIFENFIDVSLQIYGLYPSHYVTAPSLALDTMLKTTGVELELLSDGNMYLFFEQGIRGGVSKITNRYSKADNKYMGDLYNPNQPSTHIQYLDINGLYDWGYESTFTCMTF